MLEFKRITESTSDYRDLEKKSAKELLDLMNHEDHKVADAVALRIPEITILVEVIVEKLRSGGRLFYIGAGTSGRLGVLDASECPPTFGVPQDMVIGLIAGGDGAIRKAVEGAEDSLSQAWKDLSDYSIDEQDIVIGLAASGTTPYVVNGLKDCKESRITTACITCNPGSPVTIYADHKIVCIVGPEFVTGSTRLKSGTAQKLILNMISTATMILLGRVLDNKMVDMALSNNKLWDRGIQQITEKYRISREHANELLLEKKSVREVFKKLDEQIT
ncbi:MAG: N-acetylmuramic acid 6-phosphate etherase [Saprospiraceae bacterium]